MSKLSEFFRNAAPLPPKPETSHVLRAALGGFAAIAALACMADWSGAALMLGSFGASCVLVFGFPESPFAQPRNVIAGHFLSSMIGLCCLDFVGPQWWSLALAVAIAIAVMMAGRIVHPPAGSNPVIVFLASSKWSFLFLPTLAGACLLVIIGIAYNRFIRKRVYPQYW
jgi:CBS-domain-containing membrane protein